MQGPSPFVIRCISATTSLVESELSITAEAPSSNARSSLLFTMSMPMMEVHPTIFAACHEELVLNRIRPELDGGLDGCLYHDCCHSYAPQAHDYNDVFWRRLAALDHSASTSLKAAS